METFALDRVPHANIMQILTKVGIPLKLLFYIHNNSRTEQNNDKRMKTKSNYKGIKSKNCAWSRK